jgi:hypothetical protein
VWSALGTGVDGDVYALAVLPGGDLIAGGFFATAGGVSATDIARWNGTAWSALGTGISRVINALAVLPNGDLIAGGSFTAAGGVAVPGIARYGLAGAAPAVSLEPRNATACAGDEASFSVVAGGTAPLSYQWRKGGMAVVGNPSASTATLSIASAGTADAGVYDCVVSDPCGRSVVSSGAALTVETCAPPCAADFNQDGGVDGVDVAAFFGAWESAALAADVNQDGGVDGADIESFFTLWEAGGC